MFVFNDFGSIEMLSSINKKMILSLSMDLLKSGYKPFLVSEGLTRHYVESVGHVMNILFFCDDQVKIFYKAGVGDNVVLKFDFESESVAHVDQLSNSLTDFVARYFKNSGVAL
jgi:hypothetical protein